ncbi:MAG: hypothetical protein ACKOWF_10745 [Chloroflexota bacterium]
MDQSSFDRIARLLGGAASRRAGLQAALGGLLGLGALEAAEAKGGKGKDPGKGRERKRRPAAEGPCGNGSRKDNACTKDKQCCTGICNKKAGKKNLDGKGRCRCVRKNGACKEDRNCCSRKGQKLACTNGKCGGANLIPNGEPCTRGGVACEDSGASCTTYDEGSGGPAGTYCLLPQFETVCKRAADCACNSCFDGTCIICGCGPCPEPGVCAAPTVASGGSIQAAIDAAVDGATISIAPGTYVEDITYSGKSLTLLGCPSGSNEVILINATQGKRTIDVTDESDLTIGDLVIQGDNDIPNTVSGGGIATAGGDVCIGLRTRVEGCAKFGDNGGGLMAGSNAAEDQLLRITDFAVFDGNVTDTYGGGVYVDDGGTATVNGKVRFINTSAKYGGGIGVYYTATLAVTGNVEITDNNGDSYGGGVMFYGGGFSAPVTRGLFGGNVLIARNTSPGGVGGGIAGWYSGSEEMFIIEDNVVIDGNSCDTYGGGVAIRGANLTISGNVKITNNVQSDEEDKTTYGGGGVYFDDDKNGGVLTIEGNTEISGNSTSSAGGGVLAFGPTVNITGAEVSRNNTAKLAGGGFASPNDDTVMTLTLGGSTTISGNSTPGDGGGIWWKSGTIVINDTVSISGNSADSYGGGIFADTYQPFTLTIASTASITGNTANAGGGATAPFGGGIYINSINYTAGSITGCNRVTGNTPDQVTGSSAVITTC